MKAILLAAIFSVFSTLTFADGARDCDQALVKSTYSSISSDHLDARLATFVTSDTYDSIKHDAGGNVVIYGVPVGGTYSDFQDAARKSLAQSNSSLTHDQAVNILWTGLDPNAVTLYSKCLDEVAFSSFGLHVGVKSATKTDVTLIIKYVAGFHDPKTLNIKWTSNIKTVDGKPFPSSVNIGNGSIVIVNRPQSQQAVAVHSSVGDDSIVLDPLPEPAPKHVCRQQQGTYNFYGDQCGDGYSVVGQVVVVSFGSGGSIAIPKNNPAYHAEVGFWGAGDFNGSGLTDLVHFVIGVPGLDPYVHVHFSLGKGDFAPPTAGFNFRQHANTLGNYEASIGSWSIGFDPNTKRSTLVHDPKLPDGRIHVWRSNGDGTFNIGVP